MKTKKLYGFKFLVLTDKFRIAFHPYKEWLHFEGSKKAWFISFVNRTEYMQLCVFGLNIGFRKSK